MPAKIVTRRSGDRGYANHGWLDTHHTFSFASYYDPEFEGFGSLRVINEDKVDPQSGFGTHSHREFEIFSYIISGELEHRDSIGNVEILKRGDVQFTTAGTGISHSEYNVHPSLPVHFLQIWVKPDTARLAPEYHTKSFTDTEKTNSLVHIIAPVSKNNNSTIGIHTDFNMYASILEPGHSVNHVVQGEGSTSRRLYVHLASTGGQIKVSGKELLKQGDGAFFTDVLPDEEILFENVGDKNGEFILFDLA
ncbi:7160_t:CDS:2 [Ambispora gerdemannii]|uniref:7160_t:CDS:1 n=1 Tax=Ambispora gerdemannii TaxID=144530 RepID=A0A9N8V877_9GLOM|nr:7160_t:CDS:2 [Ambispora gerdemannii]